MDHEECEKCSGLAWANAFRELFQGIAIALQEHDDENDYRYLLE